MRSRHFRTVAFTVWLISRVFVSCFSVQSLYYNVLRHGIFFSSSIMPVGLKGLQILCRLVIVTLCLSPFGRVKDFRTAFLLGFFDAFDIIFDVFFKKGEWWRTLTQYLRNKLKKGFQFGHWVRADICQFFSSVKKWGVQIFRPFTSNRENVAVEME